MSFLFPILSIVLLIFIIYNLNILKIDNSLYIVLMLISVIIATSLSQHEKLVLPILMLFYIITIYLKTKKLVKSIVTVCLSGLIIMIVDKLSVLLLFSTVFSTSKIENIRENFIQYIILYFIDFLLSYFICYILNKIFKNKLNLDNLNPKENFSFFLVMSLLLTFMIYYINTVLFMDINIITKQQEALTLFMFLLYFVLLILIYNTLYKNIKKEAEFTNRKNEFENLKQYTKTMESFYKEMRKFKHDYINILSSMSGYIDTDDMNGLKKYFEENIISLGKEMDSRDFKLDLLQDIKILELKGIVSSKVIMAYEKNIDVFIDISNPIENISMNIIDLCRIIGILLDNAIEASQESYDKSLEIGLINKDDSISIIIINSFPENLPPIFKIYEGGFSTKGTDRGLGLYSLKEILSNYDNTFLDTSIENNKFVQVLNIKNL